jgi:hypothetical protein
MGIGSIGSLGLFCFIELFPSEKGAKRKNKGENTPTLQNQKPEWRIPFSGDHLDEIRETKHKKRQRGNNEEIAVFCISSYLERKKHSDDDPKSALAKVKYLICFHCSSSCDIGT